eukprot:scaffold7016_cov66-Phaeocystis_antarctica.AAC.4
MPIGPSFCAARPRAAVAPALTTAGGSRGTLKPLCSFLRRPAMYWCLCAPHQVSRQKVRHSHADRQTDRSSCGKVRAASAAPGREAITSRSRTITRLVRSSCPRPVFMAGGAHSARSAAAAASASTGGGAATARSAAAVTSASMGGGAAPARPVAAPASASTGGTARSARNAAAPVSASMGGSTTSARSAAAPASASTAGGAASARNAAVAAAASASTSGGAPAAATAAAAATAGGVQKAAIEELPPPAPPESSGSGSSELEFDEDEVEPHEFSLAVQALMGIVMAVGPGVGKRKR